MTPTRTGAVEFKLVSGLARALIRAGRVGADTLARRVDDVALIDVDAVVAETLIAGVTVAREWANHVGADRAVARTRSDGTLVQVWFQYQKSDQVLSTGN